MKTKTIAELNKIYDEADSADKEVFAEMRSNVLLVAGEHFTKRAFRDRPNLRDSRDLSYDNQKLRIVKNHIHRAVRHYVTNILTHAPDVTIVPQDPVDIQDRKSAQLNLAVKRYFDYKYRMKERIRQYCENFIRIGEICVKIFYDPNAGDLKGYEPKVKMDDNNEPMQDDMGNPVHETDEQGNPLPDETKPIMTGGFVFEEIYGMNLLRHVSAKNMQEAYCLINRKMVPIKDLKKLYADNEDALKAIQETRDETFIVFDSSKTSYSRSKDECMVREYYYRPCAEYPEGYYYISTQHGILEEGPLPFGIFPIIWQGFDTYPTTPRGRSMIKVARPFQAEINRASSSVAQHQVTLGDDKILYQAGTKLAPGALLPGVRGVTYQGAQPTVLSGRSGDQYTNYIQTQIMEMDRVLMIEEINQEKAQSMDPMSLLFASIKQKQKFSTYGEKFEQFEIDFWELTLKLAKHYMSEDELIPAVGKSEFINISEFKNTLPLNYQVRIEAKEDTLETQMGKQFNFQHILQYASGNLTRDDIGKLMRNAPFSNDENAFKDLTINYDIMENDMLALERGKMPNPATNIDPAYAINRLDLRMKQQDFELLSPQIQQNYTQFRQQFVLIQAQQSQKEIDAKNQYIPIDGAMIACDMYVPDKNDPQKAAKRVRVPYSALNWLIQRLESQGANLDVLQHLNSGSQSDIADQVLQHANAPNAMHSPMGAMQQ